MYLRITWTIEKSNSFVQFILHLVESTNIYSVRYICVMDMLQVSKYGLQRVKIIDIIQEFFMLDSYPNVLFLLKNLMCFECKLPCVCVSSAKLVVHPVEL